MRNSGTGWVFLVALAVSACGGSSGPDPSPPDPVPEFLLPDVNPASGTAGQQVSPRDLLDSVSAWYFTHAT